MIEKSKDNRKIVGTILIILLVFSIGINFYLYNLSSKNNTILPEEKALIDVQVYQWAENLDNSSELFFNYWIYNYGEVEAKNVKVKCDLFESDGKTKRKSVIDSYGNIASKSEGFGEVITDMPDTKYNEKFMGLCHVEDCDNCEILYKRIPELIETYN